MLLRALALLLVALLGSWPQLAVPDWHGTEGRRVQIALEMLQNGDLMVPTLGGQPTWAKPPLHYWLLDLVAATLGTAPWQLRLPSVLGLWLAAWLALELLRRWFGPAAGWAGGLGMLLSPIALVVWPTAEIDPLFGVFTAASLWCLATGVARDRRALVAASGLLGGLAMLQKGPPFFLFAAGAYLVWWRHRRLRHALLHLLPLFALPLAYFVPLWLWRVAPEQMLAVASDETVGRITTFTLDHVLDTPAFWVRAVLVQMPFVLWCFWEWRSARDARMDPGDLTLRMCSGAAVLAVVGLTFFPGRPTRYLLPNVLLFGFAVAPAVAHFAGQQRPLGARTRQVLRGLGAAGAAALLVVPFVPRAGIAAVPLAAAIGLLPWLVRTPRQLVAACLLLPLVGAWTVGFERALRWPESPRARAAAGAVLHRELQALGATALATFGHLDAPLLLGAGLLPPGDEAGRAAPTAPWLLCELPGLPLPDGYRERLRLCVPGRTYVVLQRAAEPR